MMFPQGRGPAQHTGTAVGHGGDCHPSFSPLADQIPLCNPCAKRRYDIQSRFKDFVLLPSRSADPQDPHPGCSWQ